MNNNPQVVSFANDRCRPLADTLHRLRLEAESLALEYQNGSYGAAIDAATWDAVIDDGSTEDGRRPITGGELIAFVSIVQALHTTLTEQGRDGLIAKIQVNGVR